MTDNPVFKEIEASEDYSLLSPGLYSVNCPGKFDSPVIQHLIQCASSIGEPAFFNGTYVGMMLPYYFHNANNLMVGVMGNLDLADMFMPDTEKVKPKLAGARTATGSVVEYIRDISSSIPSSDTLSLDHDSVKKCLILLKAACGRSVNCEGLEEIDMSGAIDCTNPSCAFASFLGISAWAVLSLGGSGTVSGSFSDKKLSIKWARAEGMGLSYMPGAENVSSILASAAGLALSAGMIFVVENCTENCWEVSLVTKQ